MYIIVYDITNDVLRYKVANKLKDYGLERIQYSAFCGELVRHRQRSLEIEIRKLLNDGEETDSVIFFPLCNSCFSNRKEIGFEKEMDKDGEGVTVF
jgi:CRISPR-associated protein Cas2